MYFSYLYFIYNHKNICDKYIKIQIAEDIKNPILFEVSISKHGIQNMGYKISCIYLLFFSFLHKENFSKIIILEERHG